MIQTNPIPNYDDADDFALRQEQRQHYLAYCVKNGVIRLCHDKWAGIRVILWLVAVIAADTFLASSVKLPEIVAIFIGMLVLRIALALLCTIIVLGIYGCPRGNPDCTKNLRRIGFYNSACEIPFLLRKYPSPKDPDVTVMEFESFGLDTERWKAEQSKLQSALNVLIAKIETGTDQRHILLYTLPGDRKLPTGIEWKWEYGSDEDFRLVLGQGLLGPVSVNLNSTPHLLIAGGTGSGKTSLLKCVLGQCIRKGAEVFIADFKGGVDFNLMWQGEADVLTDIREVHQTVEYLVTLLEQRKRLFVETGTGSIQAYNRIVSGHPQMKHVVFAVDEMAALTLATPGCKQDKDRQKEILDGLALLATQGRQFAIHLILSTQRPDRDVMPGQIKCNVDYSVCGRANQTLSMIILDNTAASDEIPQDIPGRFITKGGEIFQGYWFDDYMI